MAKINGRVYRKMAGSMQVEYTLSVEVWGICVLMECELPNGHKKYEQRRFKFCKSSKTYEEIAERIEKYYNLKGFEYDDTKG